MIHNVLDNALEASPGWVGLDVAHEGDALKLTITDAGPGFPPEMLAQLGKPYQSSKGKPWCRSRAVSGLQRCPYTPWQRFGT